MITCEPSAAAGTVWTLLNESAALVDGEAFLRTDRDEVASPQALEALESHGMSVHETTGATWLVPSTPCWLGRHRLVARGSARCRPSGGSRGRQPGALGPGRPAH